MSYLKGDEIVLELCLDEFIRGKVAISNVSIIYPTKQWTKIMHFIYTTTTSQKVYVNSTVHFQCL